MGGKSRQWALANFDASFNFDKSIQINETSFALILNGKKVFSPESLTDKIELSDTGKKYLEMAKQNQKFDEFVFLTGTEIVTNITRQYMISVVYYFQTSSRQQKEKLLARLQSGWNSGAAKVDFSREISEVDSRATFHIMAYENGASSYHESLADLIKIDPNNIAAVKGVLGESLKKATKENAPIIEARTAYLNEQIAELMFSDDQLNMAYSNAIKLNLEINNRLETLYAKSFALSQEVEKLNSILSSGIFDSQFKEKAKEKLTALLEGYKNRLKQIKYYYANFTQQKLSKNTTVDALVKSMEKDLSALDIGSPLQYSDYLLMPFILLTQWNNSETDCIRIGDTEFFDFHHFFSPTLAITNAYTLISRIEIFDRSIFLQALNLNDLINIRANGGDTRNSKINVFSLEKDALHIYGFGWQCHFCPGLRAGLKSDHEKEVKDMQIKMVIYTTDGAQHTVDLGNPMALPKKLTADVIKSYLENVDQPLAVRNVLTLSDGSIMGLVEIGGLYASVKVKNDNSENFVLIDTRGRELLTKKIKKLGDAQVSTSDTVPLLVSQEVAGSTLFTRVGNEVEKSKKTESEMHQHTNTL